MKEHRQTAPPESAMTPQSYIDAVLACLKHLTYDERQSIRQELAGHMEDHACALMEAGESEQEAWQQAAQAMGDPRETGVALGRQYRFFWLLLRRTAIALTALMCLTALLGLGALGFTLESFTARIYPDRDPDVELTHVTYSQRVDYRFPAGNDVVRVYQLSIGEYQGQRTALLALCAYDRLPGGVVSQNAITSLTAENTAGEEIVSDFSGGGRSNICVHYSQRYIPLEPEDTAIVLRYRRFGENSGVTIPLPREEAAP